MKPFLTTRDYAYTNETFELHVDERRAMLVTRPQPKNPALYYDEQSYISHTDEDEGFVNACYQWVKRYALKRKLKLINRYIQKGANVLDIGAGTGAFVLAAREAGLKASGVEPNEKARAAALQKGIPLHASLDDLGNNRFSLITLWHVLEHLPNLEEQIARIISLLDRNGTLIVALPNYKSWDAGYYKEYWAAYDVPRHLWHFSKESIHRIFTPLGFRLVRSKPMIFDAFYIALLSGKYKNGSNNVLTAFLLGLWSNMVAATSGEYSSLIYVLRRQEN